MLTIHIMYISIELIFNEIMNLITFSYPNPISKVDSTEVRTFSVLYDG